MAPASRSVSIPSSCPGEEIGTDFDSLIAKSPFMQADVRIAIYSPMLDAMSRGLPTSAPYSLISQQLPNFEVKKATAWVFEAQWLEREGVRSRLHRELWPQAVLQSREASKKRSLARTAPLRHRKHGKRTTHHHA